MLVAYVDVLTMITSKGKLFPKAIMWEDGRELEISSFRYSGYVLSLTGKSADLYIIRIGENERKLYFDIASYKWFVEIER